VFENWEKYLWSWWRKQTMIGIFLALLAAFAYSLSVVLIRKKLDESNYFSATMMVTVTGNIILWPLALLFTNLKTVNLQGILFFIIAGMLAPGITRLLYNKGMEILGISVNASIYATYPLYSSILAVLLLDEILAPENWIGVICIVAGVLFIERSLGKPKTEPKRISKKGLIFPLLATLTIASSQLVRKYGLNIYNEPLLGVAIGYSSSFLLYLLLLTSSNMRYSTLLRKDLRLFWKPGVFLSLGWVLSFYALSYERVSIVTSLIQTEPLFILFLAHLHLKGLERTPLAVVISTILIVTGAILVSIR
jgi:drug/metabolite transporter (DMT)-like permease